MKKLILLILLILLGIFVYVYYFTNTFNKNYKIPLFNKGQTMVLASSAFSNDSSIPGQYTCDGTDINPPLSFTNVPIEAKSLALTVEDINASGFTHWVIFNLEPQSNGINENSTGGEGSIEGVNDFGTNGHGGPCPTTAGIHHYVFTLYALSDFVNLTEGSTKKELLDKLQNITLQSTTLTGLYKKQ